MMLCNVGMPPTLHGQKVVKAIYTTNYAKVQLNGEMHNKVMYEIGVKERCPLSHRLFNMYIE